jgi:Na+-translocating ferredoxin:NAD+ oxidoreductase subunit G
MAEKIPSTFLNMLLVLTSIALLSAFLLGLTYTQTAERIEQVRIENQRRAVAAVVPDFDNNPLSESYTLKEMPEIEFYPATRGGERVGTAVLSYTNEGYSGLITMMVGFLPDGSISGVRVLSHSETPGLGARMTEEDFLDQFQGLDPSDGSVRLDRDGGEIDAITAATITSRASTDAVRRAYEAFQKGAEQ